MTQSFTDRVRRDGAPAAWGVALRDLSISAPNEHWEAFVHASTQTRFTVGAVATAVASAVVLAVGGVIFGFLLLLLLAWQVYAILRSRGTAFTEARWWPFAASGVGVLALLFVVFALPWPESWRSAVPGELAFWTVFVGIPFGLVLIATGVVVALGRFLERRRHPAT